MEGRGCVGHQWHQTKARPAMGRRGGPHLQRGGKRASTGAGLSAGRTTDREEILHTEH